MALKKHTFISICFKFKILIVYILLFNIFSLKSQSSPQFRHYSIRDGLSNTHINCINQDSTGLIWIGSDDGLNCFNGLDFQLYFHHPTDSTSLSSSIVHTVHVSTDRTMWIGTFKGLDQYDPLNQNFIHKKILIDQSTDRHIPVKSIVEDKNGNLWLGTSGAGVVSINKHTWKIHQIINSTSFQEFKSDFIFSMLYGKDDVIWIGTENGGAYMFDCKSNKLIKLPQILEEKTLCTFYENADNTLWIGTIKNGLFIYEPLTGKIEKFEKYYNLSVDFSKNSIFTILRNNKDKIWIGMNEDGLYMIDFMKNKIEHYVHDIKQNTSLSSNKVRVIFKDKQHNIWFGVHQKGVDLLEGFKYPFKHYNKNPLNTLSLSHNSVLSICSDNENNTWVGTDGGGLNIIDKQKNKIAVYNSENIDKWPIRNEVRFIFRDRDDNMWIGYYMGGMSCYNTKKKTFKNFTHNSSIPGSLSHDDVVAIAQDKIGNLWIATNGGGLNLYDPKKEKFINYKHDPNNVEKSVISNWLVSLYSDNDGMIWIGSYWGVCRLNPMSYSFKNFSITGQGKKAFSNNTIYSIYEDSKGRFWLGTGSGLYLMDKTTGENRVFTIQDGLPNNVINGILEDNKSNLWLSTNNGICKFNYDQMIFSNYFEYEGIQSNEFIHGAYHKTPGGELFFGGINGLTSFYPEQIRADYEGLNILITDFLVNYKSIINSDDKKIRKILEQPLNKTEKIVLPHNFNNISISFVDIDYIFPERVKYKCMLEGFDKTWQYQNYQKRQVSYTNLDPGEYVFYISSTNANGEWKENPRIIKIVIKPPFWYTWWAKIFYIALLSFSIFLIIKFYTQKIRHRNQQRLIVIQKNKEEELNKAKLQFFTNISHEFRTPLTLIIGPLEEIINTSGLTDTIKSKTEVMYRNAKRMLRLVNEILDIRKQESGKMQLITSNGNIVEFISQICKAFEQLASHKNIQFDITCSHDEINIWFDTDKIDKIIFNLLSNAFRFTPKQGVIEVNIELFENSIPNNTLKKFVAIKVSDSGKGIPEHQKDKIFERFYQSNESNTQGGTGLGLSLAKEFAQLHKGDILVESEVGKGSTFTLFLPMGDAHLTLNDKKTSPQIKTESNHSGLDNIKLEESQDNEIENNEKNEDINKPLVLIVEDNYDVCNYVRSILINNYQIEEVHNGREGWEKALEIAPDLIISDIMMPEMNGIELCKKIKTEFQTCHIPVILLTAKIAEESQIEGFETGADSYILKPFNPHHLEVRVRKLIELRKTLREKFSKDSGFELKELAVSSTDEKFLQKIMEVINTKLSDPDLSVEALGKEVGMSRSHLHRKLKSLTGQVPNEFIRIIRLKQAARLLKSTDINISEVTYIVGFSNPSYFSTCFSKYFNVSPTQYKEKYFSAAPPKLPEDTV